jgi:hypothetical protein
MDPITIGAWIELAATLSGIVGGIVQNLRAAGVSEEQLAAISLDYDQRIARRLADTGDGDNS